MMIFFTFIAVVQTTSVSALEIDKTTGLIAAPGIELVKAHCIACHSPRLITQNKADRQGWLSLIRWMQNSQGLWPLGDNEPIILDYLSANYGPQKMGRRNSLPSHLMPP